MKYLFRVSAPFVLALIISFNVLGQSTQQRRVGSFAGIKVAEGIDVYLKKGDKEELRVEASGVSLDNVITEVSGSYLKIHMRNSSRGRVQVKVYVTYVKLEKLSASSAANIFSEDPLRSKSLTIQCSSAANIELKVDVGNIEVSASSAGQVELQGKAKQLIAEASSAGQIDAYDVDAQQVEAQASSSGSLKVSVQDNLVANASSGGSIRYRGNPSKSITNSSSGGSVKKSN